MESKKDLTYLINQIKTVTGFNQNQIAERIKYSREHLSRAKKSNDKELYDVLSAEFYNELNNIPSPTSRNIQPDDRALLQALLFEVANIKAERENLTFDEAVAAIRKNTNLVKAGM